MKHYGREKFKKFFCAKHPFLTPLLDKTCFVLLYFSLSDKGISLHVLLPATNPMFCWRI